MTKQARKGADQGGGLDVSEAIKPVEKALDRLTDRTNKCRESVARNQGIAFLLFPWSKQLNGVVLHQ